LENVDVMHLFHNTFYEYQMTIQIMTLACFFWNDGSSPASWTGLPLGRTTYLGCNRARILHRSSYATALPW